MPYSNGDLTLGEQLEQHAENRAISKELSTCWNEGYAEGLKAANADLLAALKGLSGNLDGWLTTADAGLPAVVKTIGDCANLHTAQRGARAAIARAKP